MMKQKKNPSTPQIICLCPVGGWQEATGEREGGPDRGRGPRFLNSPVLRDLVSVEYLSARPLLGRILEAKQKRNPQLADDHGFEFPVQQ